MNSRQKRKAEAIEHNRALEERKKLELDKLNNPEKYERKHRFKPKSRQIRGFG